MHTKDYYELKEKLCEELEKIAKKRDLSAGDLEAAHKLTDTIKNIDKIEMLEDGMDDDKYSRAYEGRMGGRMNYDNGASYARRRNARTGRYERSYSRADGADDMIETLEDIMEDTHDSSQREIIEETISKIKRMR